MPLILVEPFAPALVGASRGSGAANLVTRDPREVWQDSGTGEFAQIAINLGSVMAYDTVALLNTNAVDGAGWFITDGVDSYLENTPQVERPLRVPSEELGDTRGPALFRASAPRLRQRVRLNVRQPDGAPPLQIGRVLIGLSWAPELGQEWGAGRPPLDTGSRSRLDDGGLAVVPGRLVSGFSWTFGDLAPDELAKLWGMMRRRRTTEELLLIEEAAPVVAEGIHYGTFTALDRYERREPDKSRWQLSFEDWL